MNYINYFVEDVMRLFQEGMIRMNRDTRMVMVEERALYMLSSTYNMDGDTILQFLEKVTKFAELPNG